MTDPALRSLLDALPAGALALDAKGRVVALNAAARALFAVPGAEGKEAGIEGKALVDLIAFAPEEAAALNELAGASSAIEVDGEVEGAEGRRVVVSVGTLGAPFSGYVALLRDVTDERRREHQRIMHEKLAAISQLAAGVAHEFNNIMASLYGFAQLARQDPAFVEELIGGVEQYTERSREITRRLRSFAPEKSGPLEAVALPDLIEEVVGRFAADLEAASIKVERRYHPVPETLVNRRELEETFETLIANARHAVVKSGTITLEVRLDEGGKAILTRVSDTGYGIPKEQLTRVFEPFFTLKQTTDTVRPGAGLGLAVVYNYVRRHNGEIWAESEVGKGTTFSVRLPVRVERRKPAPAAPAAAEAAAAEAAGVPERRTGGAVVPRSVLAVDDEEGMRRLFESILVDHKLTTARTGREALAALGRKGPFDYVILDLMLPGELDGFEIFTEVQRRDKNAKIILLTGLIEDDRLKDYAARAYGYLRKPFGIKDLSSLIV